MMVMIIMLEVDCNKKSPTVVCDFTRHQIELLEAPSFLGNDFHTPRKTQDSRNVRYYNNGMCVGVCVDILLTVLNSCFSTVDNFIHRYL